LQALQQYGGRHDDSPDDERANQSKTEKQCDSEIANEVIELPTECRAWRPYLPAVFYGAGGAIAAALIAELLIRAWRWRVIVFGVTNG
jgi:hypothetical protein